MSEPKSTTGTPPAGAAGNFIRDRILEDNASGKYAGRVATRFPPEPNGYLHIGHAKSIWINFGLAREFGGRCNLRFDDTNPTTEDVEYVESIQADIRWLGYEWDSLHFASDYFEDCYRVAEKLIEKGVAYVDSLNEEEIREYRGNFYKKGTPSPYRDRPVAESLELFRGMRAGKFKEGEHVLRAKIDLQSQNMNLRDPILYRIRYAPHHRTGTKWCIYPMYDYAHPLGDAAEKITHSICTLEFESHRPLYDWCIREAGVFPSQQIEFARLNLTYTVMSKRKFIELVQKKIVAGWDDPRMPTLAGLRRRGFTPEAIRRLCERVGVAKADSVVDVGLLEHCVREDLEVRARRVMGVVRPLKLVITDLSDETPAIERPFYPKESRLAPADPSLLATRAVPFGRELWIERDDFREDPPKDFFRLAPGREVRLRHGPIVKCTEAVKDAAGEIVEVRCTHDAASWEAGAPAKDGEGAARPPDASAARAVKGVIHWVAAKTALPVEVRLYDRLFAVENPGATEGKSFLEELNPRSLEVVQAWVEPALAQAQVGSRWQFERLGYFVVDADSKPGRLVFNRTVTLKDTWAKIEKKAAAAPAPSTAKAAAPTGDRAGQRTKTLPGTPVVPKASSAIASTEKPGEIGIEEFAKVDLRVGIVRSAEEVPEAKKLIKLMIDLGEGRDRQIFAGLRAYYPDPKVLVGERVIVVANLKPRQMKFGLSEGMVLAAGGGERAHLAIKASPDAQPGDKVQ